MLSQFDLYIQLGPNAGILSFTSTAAETFIGTVASPPHNIPYMVANVFNIFNDLNLPNLQQVLSGSNSIQVTSPYTLDVVPASQGRNAFTHSANNYD